MNRPARTVLVTLVVAATAAAWAAGCAPRPIDVPFPAYQPPAPTAVGDFKGAAVGMSGCLATGCHGGSAAKALEGSPDEFAWMSSGSVWVAADPIAAQVEGPLPLICSPRPCLHRSRATTALDRAGRGWRIAYSCGSLSGNHAALRAGLGVAVLPLDMVPHDLVILKEQLSGLPELADTEMALIEAASLSAPAQRLREHIVRDLEHGGTAGG